MDNDNEFEDEPDDWRNRLDAYIAGIPVVEE